jgi:hypothetical protein
MAKGPSAPAITKGILKLEPGTDCVPGSCCFQNVTSMVKRHGGSVQHGWKMREQPAAYVEGEFYAVWRRLDGALVDVTPHADRRGEILFMPDPRLVWTGEDVEPRRLMLNEQPCYCGSGMPFKICHNLAED